MFLGNTQNYGDHFFELSLSDDSGHLVSFTVVMDLSG